MNLAHYWPDVPPAAFSILRQIAQEPADGWHDMDESDDDPDNTCPVCGGDGMDDDVMPCPHCDGQGYEWWN